MNLFLEFFRGDHFGWARVHHLHLHLSPAREGKRERRGYEPLRAAHTHMLRERGVLRLDVGRKTLALPHIRPSNVDKGQVLYQSPFKHLTDDKVCTREVNAVM